MLPLPAATMGGHSQIVRALLDADGSTGHCDYEGDWALVLAIRKGHTEIIRMLLETRSGDLGVYAYLRSREEGMSPLHLAVKKNNIQIVRMLLEAGAIVYTADVKKRRTPLIEAARRNNVGIANLLLEAARTWSTRTAVATPR